MWLSYAILAAVLWGLNYTLAEKILQVISPVTLLALEMLVGASIFFIVAYCTHLKTDLATLTMQPRILLLTILEIFAVITASLLIVYSIRYKNATVAGMIELSYPLFTILFTWLLFRQNHLNLPVVLGSILIIAGVCCMGFA